MSRNGNRWWLVGALAIVAGSGAVGVSAPIVAAAGTPTGATSRITQLTADLQRQTSGHAIVAVRTSTGTATFIAGSAAHPLAPPTDDDPSTTARTFIDRYGSMFGVDDPSTELVETRVTEGLDGSSAVRYQQVVDGVPVLAGEIAVQIDDSGSVLSSTGESSPSDDISTDAVVTADEASATAIGLTAKYDTIDPSALSASLPELTIYDPSLIGADGTPGQRLVWSVDVRAGLGEIDRLVLVDASNGAIAFTMSQAEGAKDREVCDKANVRTNSFTCSFGTSVRHEGSAPTVNGDVNAAYDLAGVTYDYYASLFGRDSIDGAGMTILSTVRYCPPSGDGGCPYANAFWSGTQMVYGATYAIADDVVGHELTHGVTDFAARLFYYGESGAINESMSDVFGELIDLSYSPLSNPDQLADKWLIGEDLPIGAIRDMKTPSAFGDPDRMTSSNYDGSASDNHGVHANSGVGNKAAYLIADGAAFNGRTIVGLGNTKTAKIYYQANTTLLTPGSDYADLFRVLPQACTNLIGQVGITANDCEQVTNAVTATEMNLAPTTSGARLTAPVCPAGQVPTSLFTDDFETADGRWSVSSSNPAAAWGYDDGSSQSGVQSAAAKNIESVADSRLTMSGSVGLPPGTTPYLRFDHSFNLDYEGDGPFEYFDGGVVEYSANGGTDWTDLIATRTTVNGYSGTLDGRFESPLGARPAFSGASAGYQTTRVDLSTLAGSTIKIRFRLGSDNAYGFDGWFVDDVSLYACGATTLPGAPTGVTATSTVSAVALSWTAPANAGAAPISGWSVTPYADGVPEAARGFGSTETRARVDGLRSGVSYTFTVAAFNAFGDGPASGMSNAVTPVPSVVPVSPERLFDTRAGQSPDALRDVAKTRVGGTNILEVKVTDLPRGIVPANGVGAVSLNIAAINPDAPGFITAYPCGTRKLVANINYLANQVVANAVLAPISPTGTICLFSSANTDLAVDINGWFPIGGFEPVSPERVLDTRAGQSPDALRDVAKTRVGGTNILEVKVTDLPRGIVPANGVGAVSLNIAAINPDAPGFITAYPCGTRKLVANINYLANQVVANAVLAPISPTGTICLFSSANTDLAVDINGWFPIGGFEPVSPERVLDTRAGQSPDALRDVAKTRVGGTNILEVKVTDLPRGIVPANGVGAVSLNIAAINPDAPGFITAYPCGTRKLVANINYLANQVVANAVLAPISPTGTICLFSSANTDLAVDINGWFPG